MQINYAYYSSLRFPIISPETMPHKTGQIKAICEKNNKEHSTVRTDSVLLQKYFIILPLVSARLLLRPSPYPSVPFGGGLQTFLVLTHELNFHPTFFDKSCFYWEDVSHPRAWPDMVSWLTYPTKTVQRVNKKYWSVQIQLAHKRIVTKCYQMYFMSTLVF